jgi:hypothetical protein
MSPHLAEGLIAYATEQATAEHRRLTSWTDSWKAVRQRAALVLRHFTNTENMVDMTALELEIEEDGGEDLMHNIDADDDDDDDMFF